MREARGSGLGRARTAARRSAGPGHESKSDYSQRRGREGVRVGLREVIPSPETFLPLSSLSPSTPISRSALTAHRSSPFAFSPLPRARSARGTTLQYNTTRRGCCDSVRNRVTHKSPRVTQRALSSLAKRRRPSVMQL